MANVKKQTNAWLLTILFLFLIAATHPARQLVIQANQHYQQKQYSKAIELYKQAQTPDQPEPVLIYNRANCFYKLGNYDEAINLYNQVSAQSKDPVLTVQTKFNLGNCYFQQAQTTEDDRPNPEIALEKLSQSVKNYRETLDLDPTDRAARINLALARKQMITIQQALKQKEDQQQQQQDQQKQLPEKIKELLERQVQLLQSISPPQQPQTVNPLKNILRLMFPETFREKPVITPEDFIAQFDEDKLLDIAQQQEQLKTDTETVNTEAQQMLQALIANLEQRPQPTPNTSSPAPQPTPQIDPQQAQDMQKILDIVVKELANSITRQDTAVPLIESKDIPPATNAQNESALALKRALDAFPKPEQDEQQNQDKNQDNQNQQNDQQEQEQNPDQQQNQQNQDQQQDQQDQQQSEPQQQEEQEMQSQQVDPSDKTVEDILQKEKERKEQRRLIIIQNRGKGVEKDW